jgi:hypothetical protein
MHPASYGVQHEVKIRHRIQQHEAEQRRLARVAHDGQEPAVGGLLVTVAHVMHRTRGATRAGLEKLRSGVAWSSEPQRGRC